ncbi:uncharacterized protein LOC117646231 isoform X2 [Thrips palmi]|uniref:Uncharacterized protein LOC117646231 isoform X2 n=1 Tax=Thrips palmi TaxID=161013 RepID=A0A6P8Z012_THRPL|nr:uncharacterized protein LOC117646231 isoform X2 [Thrips palmi]
MLRRLLGSKKHEASNFEMECVICVEKLDSARRRPKCIPCGHTVCLQCISTRGKQVCPLCQQEFAEPVGSLPDNFFLLKLIEKEDRCSDQRLWLWCRDCSKAATDDCEDRDHSLCSLRKLRAEQSATAAARLRGLQEAATAVRHAVRALQDVKGAADALLDQWRHRLRRVEDAEAELRAAVDAGRLAVQPMQVKLAQPEEVRQLQDAASLLQARCALLGQLLQTASNDCDEQPQASPVLEAPPPADSPPNPPQEAVQRDGAVVKNPEAPQAGTAFSPSECRDFAELCLRTEYSQEMAAVLEDPGLAKVRKLVGLVCEGWSEWCEAVLLRAALRVECLSLHDARPEHLTVVAWMPALRHLHVHVAPDVADVPDLPLQLESLDVTNVRRRHLECVQRMPLLRKLALDWSDAPLEVAFPPLPPHHCGLRWLWVALRPASSVLSLVAAHAATLQDLRITCASEGDTPWHFADLAARLRCCKLTALRSVVLLRQAPGFPDNKLPHGKDSCRKQKRAVFKDISGDLLGARVLCGECDKYPAYPSRGPPWKDN